jgi:hypothetical protein
MLIGAGTVFWLHARHFESTDDAFIDGYVTQTAPQVAGRVTKLLFVVELETLRQDRERLLAGGLTVDYIAILLVAIGFGALQIMLGGYER